MSTGLRKAQARLAEMRARGEKPERIDPLERAKRNPTSLRHAINAKCWDCIGGDADPSPRWCIGNCEIPACPLWNVRPYQTYRGRPVPVHLRSGDTEKTEPNA